MKEFVTIPGEEFNVEVVIEKSRFLAAAIHVDSVQQATDFIAAKRKKYFDATHNCYGYVVGDKAKFSDDGEPQGTAGQPIYECIKSCGLDQVCVVVTRYFGGIKLGAGGLVRAYGGSCAEVLKSAPRVNMIDCTLASAVVDYTYLKPLRRAVLAAGAKEHSVQYGDKVTLVFLFPTLLQDTISHVVTQNTLGKSVLTPIERLLCPFD